MILAMDLGGTAVKLGLFRDGVALHTAEHLLANSPVSHLDDLERMVADFIATCPESDAYAAEIEAVGIAVPGVVDRDQRRLIGVHAKWEAVRGVDLAAWSQKVWGVAATVENDARASLAGEVADGAARGETDVVALVLGTGVGTAALIDGVLLRGSTGHAGILGGHFSLDLTGPLCPCGNVGCAEVLASTATLAATSSFPGYRELYRAVWEVRPGAAELWDRAISVWSECAVSLVHAYDPTVLVIAGGVSRIGEPLRSSIESRVHARAWSSLAPVEVRLAENPGESVLRGVAALARTDVERRMGALGDEVLVLGEKK